MQKVTAALDIHSEQLDKITYLVVQSLLLDIRVVFSQQEIKLGGQPQNSPLHIDNHVNKEF